MCKKQSPHTQPYMVGNTPAIPGITQGRVMAMADTKSHLLGRVNSWVGQGFTSYVNDLILTG